jgi:hypothetical protein
LQEWGEIVIGEWTAEFVSPATGLSNGKVSVSWIPGKDALQGSFNMGSLSGRWTAVWDSTTGQIYQRTSNSDGSMVLAIVSKQAPNQWLWTQSCSFSSGQQETNIDIVTLSDGGNTLSHHVTDRIVDGRPLPDIRMILRREASGSQVIVSH